MLYYGPGHHDIRKSPFIDVEMARVGNIKATEFAIQYTSQKVTKPQSCIHDCDRSAIDIVHHTHVL